MVWDEIRGRVLPDTCVKEAKPATVGRLTPGLRALHARAALAGLKALSTASTETILWGGVGAILTQICRHPQQCPLPGHLLHCWGPHPESQHWLS